MHNICFAFSLFIIGLIALSNFYISLAILCYIVGIWLLVKGLHMISARDSKQSVPPMPSAPSAPSSEPQEPWQRLQLEKPFKTITIKPVGITFNCMFSEFYESRQKVLSFTGEGTNIALRQYTHNGEPAIAIINADLNADIGVVPRDKIEMVLDFIKKYDLVLIATDCDSFYPDDDNEDSDKEVEPIYTCKVLIYAYKRPEM